MTFPLMMRAPGHFYVYGFSRTVYKAAAGNHGLWMVFFCLLTGMVLAMAYSFVAYMHSAGKLARLKSSAIKAHGRKEIGSN